MSRALWVLVPAAAAVGAVIGAELGVAAGVVLGALLGLVAAAAVWHRQSRRIDALADAINRWVGRREPPEPVTVSGGAHWRRLAVAVNALGGAYHRRGEHVGAERRRLRRLVEQLPVPTVLFDAGRRLLVANRRATELLGAGAVPGARPVEVFGDVELGQAVDAAAEGDRPVVVEHTIDGRTVEVTAVGVDGLVVVVLRDLSAELSARAVRRDFVANASHELKTPVAGIRSLAEGLAVTIDRDPQRARELVAQLVAESERLDRLVHDLLDLRRLEEPGVPERAPVDLVALIRDVVAELRPVAEEQQVTVDTELPDRAVVAGAADELRLVVANLVDNAIRYNRPGGRVWVRLRRRDAGYELEVSDTGIGIPRTDLDRVFERFYRVEVARSRARGGTGLGLSLVKHAVERHGGTVQLDSLLGEGTTARVVLPISQ